MAGTRRRFVVALLAAPLLGGGVPGVQAAERLTLTGSSTVAPLALEIAKRFEQRHPGVRVDVQTGGSSRGIADVRRGSADIGMVSRVIRADERDLRGHTIALDGVSLIVHASNPVGSLSDAQVKAIFTGQVRDWRELGGPAGPITVVHKAEGRSTLEVFLQHHGLRNSEVRAQVVIGDNQQGIKTVLANPGAIGYVSIGTAEHEVSQGTRIRLLPMAGVAPRSDRVRDGSFPLSRPLNLVTRGEPSPLARRFLDFARSREVLDLIAAQHFVPPGVH